MSDEQHFVDCAHWYEDERLPCHCAERRELIVQKKAVEAWRQDAVEQAATIDALRAEVARLGDALQAELDKQQDDRAFKLARLREYIEEGIAAWVVNINDRDPDERYCCDGRECGCEAKTIREIYSLPAEVKPT